ncbi:MAG: FkbM family methyltransferase [Chloroflexi bacterium]|nr:FkbM family methyltransferase [Chloroflexota bacterium]
MRFKLRHYRKLFGGNPRVVLEAGIGSTSTCRTFSYWEPRVRCLLFEPSLRLHRDIAICAAEYPNVEIHWAAIHDSFGTCDFIDMGNGGSCLGDVTPRSTRPKVLAREPNATVPKVRLDHFDTGDIDLALLDMEGAEWFAVKHLVSRPKAIIIEMLWEDNETYRHPHHDELMQWFSDNGYIEHSRDPHDIMFLKERI